MEEAWEFAVVSTSAASLHNSLAIIAQQNKALAFAKAVMASIGNPNGDASEAFRLMSEQYLNLEADIEASFTDQLESALKNTAAPFKALLRFSTYDQSVQNLSNNSSGNFLTSARIDSLLMLDAALQGKCERPSLELTDDIKTAFSELREIITELSLPSNIQHVMEIRIDQLERAAREFSFYGMGGLTKSIEELMGAVEVYAERPARESKSYKKFRTKLVTAVMAVTGAVAMANTGIKETKELASHVEKAAALLPDLSKPSGDE